MARKFLMPLQQVNQHKVSPRQWKKWCDLAQRVFNATYTDMVHNQGLFVHPKADPVSAVHWKTTAWNAAWIAAEAVQVGLKDIEEGKGYAREPAKKPDATKPVAKKVVAKKVV
jgi:hypothetical protein